MGLRVSSLTFVGFYVNSLVHDHPGDMTFDEIHLSLENETILEDLAARYPGEIDFSLFGRDSDQRAPLLKILRESAGGLEGRERRKVGVESCGLNLLMAVVLESIQRLNN